MHDISIMCRHWFQFNAKNWPSNSDRRRDGNLKRQGWKTLSLLSVADASKILQQSYSHVNHADQLKLTCSVFIYLFLLTIVGCERIDLHRIGKRMQDNFEMPACFYSHIYHSCPAIILVITPGLTRWLNREI